MLSINKLKEDKNASILLLGIIISSLAFAWILELGFGMKPCSLCLLQRFGMYVASFFLIIKVFLDYINNKSTLIKKILLSGSFLGLFGSLIAGLRQTYIQSLPEDQLPSCGADLETLLSIVTPFEAIKKVFEGSGECAEKALTVIGLSLANWATILFFILLAINLHLIIRKNNI